MSSFSWKEFLTFLNQKQLDTGISTRHQSFNPELYPPEVLSSGWLGFPGATEEQIVKAETRLGAKLPLSYREFLKVSNGWRGIGHFIPQVWSIEEIEWFVNRRSELLSSVSFVDDYLVPDEEYLVYGAGQSEHSLRWEYLLTALEVSDMEVGGTAVFLLNPKIIDSEGEWEAWFFAHWLPGAVRYRSFQDLMVAEYKNLD